VAHLGKLRFATVQRTVTRNAVADRRSKLIAGIGEQKRLLELVQSGASIERAGEGGKRAPRTWFFEQGGAWYVQCRYGARVLPLGGGHNSVMVRDIGEVVAVLDAFADAAAAGELDAALAQAADRKRNTSDEAAGV